MDNDDIRKRLVELRAELVTLSDIAAGDRAAVELDQQAVGRLSRMDAIQRQHMAKAQEVARKRNLARIEAALVRLEAGEYGWCVECGEPIADKRLAVDPMAERCIACAGQAV